MANPEAIMYRREFVETYNVGVTFLADRFTEESMTMGRSAVFDVATLGGRVAVVELGHRPERAFDAAAYAFVLKSSSLAVKAEAKARGVEVRVAQGAVGADAQRQGLLRAVPPLGVVEHRRRLRHRRGLIVES